MGFGSSPQLDLSLKHNRHILLLSMKLRTLASTHETFHGTPDDCLKLELRQHTDRLATLDTSEYTFPSLHSPPTTYACRSHTITTRIHWLDNSSLLTVSTDNAIRTYIPQPTLLTDDDSHLLPFTRHIHSNPIITTAIHPSASVYEGVCPILVSCNETPLKLLDLIPSSADGKASVLNSYDTKCPQTEKFRKVHSLAFTHGGARVMAGRDKGMAMVYNIDRKDPIGEVEVVSRGIVSCLSTVNGDEMDVYAGSLSNWVSRVDRDGLRVMEVKIDHGNGVSQIIEAKNGRFVFVRMRNSDAISVMDVRMGMKEIDTLSGSPHESQRLFGDCLANSQGLIAGTSQGHINWFKDAEIPESTAMSCKVADAPIPSIAAHPSEPSLIAYGVGEHNFTTPGVYIASIE